MGDLSQTLSREELTVLYLYQAPLADIPWKDMICFNDVKDQELLLDSTARHEMCQKYPPLAEYTRKFLKKVINTLEAKGAEICEDLYTLYVESLESCKSHSSFSYKSYYLFSIGKFIPLLECSSFLSCGTTGLNTWPGARILADWCIHNKTLFIDKHIIELGAGIGLSGIMVSKACLPASYLFTDYHEKVLKILSYNVKLNFDNSTLVRNDGEAILNEPLLLPSIQSNHHKVVTVDSIDWTDECGVDNVLKKHGGFDVILAADVVFEPSLLASLVNTIYRIMNWSHHSKKSCTGYFSVVVRNDETFEKFIAQLNSKLFDVVELDMNFPCHVKPTHNQEINFKLLKIEIPASA